MKVISIILARGGSKGIPNKNIIEFCGKPLLAWTIQHCFDGGVDKVYVSSDDENILDIGKRYGCLPIIRPNNISGDKSSSESAWLHALEIIEKKEQNIDWILAPQVTSPLRTGDDIKNAIQCAKSTNCDSLFSVSEIEDFFMWKIDHNNIPISLNYDFKNRKRRQLIDNKYLENGSFYLFKPRVLKSYSNRLGGKIELFIMEKHKMFQIDNKEDIKLCEVIMKGYNYC